MSLTQQGIAAIYNGTMPMPQRGGSFGSFVKGANNFLHKTHLVSGLANVASIAGVPGASVVGQASKAVGYGKKRKQAGGKKKKTTKRK
jgi:hypothetical protein